MKKKTSMILQNKTLIGASILAFFVCSSKNLIIYNEEILVALSFLLFVLFSFHSFQETVKQTFQDRKLCEMTLVTSKNHSNQTLMNLIEKICFKKEIVKDRLTLISCPIWARTPKSLEKI